MVDFSCSDAKQWLGVSSEVTAKLDLLDGKSDGKIKDSIFDEAVSMIEEAKNVNDMTAAEKFLQKVKGSKVGNIILSKLKETIGSLPQIKALKKAGFNRMSTIADAADVYIKEHGSPAGFSMNNIPIGIKSVKLVKCQAENTSAQDDTITFDANGNSVIKRKNDAVKYMLEWTWLDGSKEKCNVPFYSDF